MAGFNPDKKDESFVLSNRMIDSIGEALNFETNNVKSIRFDLVPWEGVECHVTFSVPEGGVDTLIVTLREAGQCMASQSQNATDSQGEK